MDHKPEPGTRVRWIDYGDEFSDDFSFTGTVQGGDDSLLSHDTVSVLRDDAVEGAGMRDPVTKKYGYLVMWKSSCFQLYSCEDSIETDKTHIMGLSPEEIDRDKYDAFMRDLQS